MAIPDPKKIHARYSLKHIDTQARTFLLCALGLAYTTGQAGFEIGVYGELLFERKVSVWITVTAAFFALLVLPKDKLQFQRRHLLVLLIPSLWMIVRMATKTLTDGHILIPPLFALSVVSYIACLPYAVYLIVQVLTPEFLELPGWPPKLRLGAVGIVFFLSGLFVGAHHYWLLSCHDFEIAGSSVPADCHQPAEIPTNYINGLRKPPPGINR